MIRIRRMHKIRGYLAPGTIVDVVGVTRNEIGSTSLAAYCDREFVDNLRVISIENRQTGLPAHGFVAFRIYFGDLFEEVTNLFGGRHHLLDNIIDSLRQLVRILG